MRVEKPFDFLVTSGVTDTRLVFEKGIRGPGSLVSKEGRANVPTPPIDPGLEPPFAPEFNDELRGRATAQNPPF